MAGDDAEPTPSGHGMADGTEAERPKGKRQRAADLFSPHRYRAMQLSAFERRFARKTPEAPAAGEVFAGEDDAVDPPLDSSAPAAVAARADVPGTETAEHADRLSPVSWPDGIPTRAEGLDTDRGIAAVVGEDSGLSSGEATRRAVPWPDAEDTADLGLLEDFDFEGEAESWAPDHEWDLPTADHVGPDVQEQIDDETPLAALPRGGRNLPLATGVGVALLVMAVSAAWFDELVFAGVLYTFAIGALIEWKRALARHGRRIPLIPLVAATLGMGIATWYAKPEGLVVALLVGCAGVVAWRIGDERVENTLADSLAGVLTLLWIPFLASFLLLLELADDGWMRVVIVVLAVVGNDTGGLLAGMFLGKHKLLERVSPKKTWEGAIGGAVLGTVAAAVASYIFFDGDWVIGAAVGFACTVAAVIGDLAESALKRDIHIKDMSSAIPGHGGILDRIDSLLFAAPVGYVVFALFLGTLGGGGL